MLDETMTVILTGVFSNGLSFTRAQPNISIPKWGQRLDIGFRIDGNCTVLSCTIVHEQTREQRTFRLPPQAFSSPGDYTVNFTSDPFYSRGKRSARSWHKRIKEVRQHVGLVER